MLAPILALAVAEGQPPASSPLPAVFFLVAFIYGLVVSTKRWITLGVAALALLICIAVVVLTGYLVHLPAYGTGFLAGTLGLPCAGIAAAFHGHRNQKKSVG